LNIDSCKPFVVALYYGVEKPPLEQFLHDFVTEMKSLLERGINFKGQHLHIAISSFVCDAPACASLKNIKPHNAYFACEKCITEGKLGKMCYPDLFAPLRTDASFNSMLYEEHHYGPTPLAQLPIGLVSQVPLDYMHLVCLGIVKKLIKLWRTCSHKESRMSPITYETVSDAHKSLCKFIPKEFARSPHALSDHPRWKATEFRTFLLYTGPVALSGNVSDEYFSNFFDVVLWNSHSCEPISLFNHEL
jgi:hypothetical protein